MRDCLRAGIAAATVFGLISTHVTPATKIKSLEIVGNGGIDNLQFLSASASMPEPASYALFGAGLVGIGALAVKKRNEN